MRDRLKNLSVSFVLLSILYILLGLVLLIWPATVMDVLCYLTGGILLLYGVFAIVGFCRAEVRTAGSFLTLLLGIVAAAVGAVLLLQPALFQSILTVILGLYILIDGLLNLMRALELRRMEHGGWTIYLVLSLITVVLGLVVVFRPILAGTTLVQLIGASLLYSGAADLWTLFQLSRWTREYRKTHPVEVDPVDPE
ncbi:HdeD family acid-resistance protein [Intestinimonas massiliensis (ex Afouda et al. 2020)]|uniref:HdeD family acid-resistance protein n=1 Tax=Intestinimonas massiliensis (ex Afouda et al. 2020) TaxID=1673721 RepID=UPI001030E470|nr:DUF308 domain-containing protein [Intestinimonas massiliensis (ex Afouda et al. 2020)]